jgi:DNA-directed RNA polymerase specialized sigma24 family protein
VRSIASESASAKSPPAPATAHRTPPSEPIELHALIERNYAALRRIARRSISVARAADTISPTSLVAESVIRLMRQRSLPQNTPHLCGLATILMAQAIADRSKMRRAQKRGRGQRPVPLTGDVTHDGRRTRAGERHGSISTAEILRHLEVLGASIPRTMEVVTLNLVLGIPLDRVAEMLSVSERTAYRELLLGRERLAQRLLLKEVAT